MTSNLSSSSLMPSLPIDMTLVWMMCRKRFTPETCSVGIEEQSMDRIELKNKTILVTGAAGFIGSNLVLKLLETASPVKKGASK